MATNVVIGIPRSLFYFNYYPFCKVFFTKLGIQILVSEKTNKEMLQRGLKASINELCLPIKLLYGHILSLSGKVDYIFLPYIVTLDKDSYICPKLMAVPDIIKSSIPDTTLLSVDIDINNFYTSLFASLKQISTKLSVNPVKLFSAYKDAIKMQSGFEENIHNGYFVEEAMEFPNNNKIPPCPPLSKGEFKFPSLAKRGEGRFERYFQVKWERDTIAVIGHSYVINDQYISSDLINKLILKGMNVLTSDMLSQEVINEINLSLDERSHWTLGNRVISAALYFSSLKDVKGIIYLTPFGCASDSLIKEYIFANMKAEKPFMTIIVDEHSGDAGLITRIEAFLDMIERKR